MVQTRPRLVIRSLRSRSCVTETLSIKKYVHIHTCFIFEYMPIILPAELGDGFLGLESDICAGVHVLLVQPSIASFI